MITRRLPALVAVLVGIASLVAVGRDTATTSVATFASPPQPWMPALSTAEVITSNWFCPGVPATGEEGVGGEVVVTNTSAEQRTGRLLVYGAPGAAGVDQSLTLAPRSQQRVDIAALVQNEFVAASVEIDGGGVVVEQVARHPAGDAVTPCATSASATWYLADGFTAGGSDESLVLSNPYDGTAVVDFSFTTTGDERTPPAFQGVPIAGRSLLVVRLGELTRDEQVISVKVEASRGRVVLGRAQHYVGGGRLGYGMTLAVPAPREQWWFADGARSADSSERFVIYNPTDDDVEVVLTFLGIPVESEFAGVDPITVPARRVVTFDTASVTALPESRHGAVVASFGTPSIVVERVLTRVAEGDPYTSVVAGGVARPDGFVSSQWYVAAAPSTGVVGGLSILNMQNADGTVTVSYVGPSGPVPLAGLVEVPLASAGVLDLDLVDPAAVGLPLIIESTVPVMVERRLPRGDGRVGLTQSWAIPVA